MLYTINDVGVPEPGLPGTKKCKAQGKIIGPELCRDPALLFVGHKELGKGNISVAGRS
jgi:hypothetical protein